MNKIFPPRERFESLDGLRAIAAFGIVIMHVQANMTDRPILGYVTSTIISSLSMLILLFMILSSFSMCCGYYEKIKNRQITPNEFYTKRVKRILPFFAVMTIIDVIVEHNFSSICEGLSNITLFFNFFQRDIKVIGVGWFIGVVCMFYLLFPCFVALMDNKKRAVIVTFMSVILTCISIDYYKIDNKENFSLYFPFFAIGGLIYIYRKEIINLVSMAYSFVFFICLIITIVYFAVPINDPLILRLEKLILFSSWTCFAIAKDNIILSNKFVKFVSNISMEIYLCHMLVFRIAEKLQITDLTSNIAVNYLLVCIFTMVGASVFSYIVKYKLINRVIFHN